MIVIKNVQPFFLKLGFINGENNGVEEDNNVYYLGEGNESICGYKFIYLGI